MRITHLIAASLLASVALTGCSGDDEEKKEAASCPPVKGAASVALRDDQGVLPAANVVSVTVAKGNYQKPLTEVDRVTRAISSADVAQIASIPADQDKKRAKAIASALVDVNGKAGSPVTVYVAVSGNQEVVADLYQAGLASGSTVKVVDNAADALSTTARGEVAVVALGALAQQVSAEVAGKNLNDQLQTVATAALKKGKFALGSVGELVGGESVYVASSVAAQNVSTVADLAKVCGGIKLAHTADSAAAAAALAKKYGFETTEVQDPAAAIAEGTAVAVLAG